MHTLIILNPGHFHAALVLRQSHPAVGDDIYVYAEQGPDLERFLEMSATFNQRSDDPTRWRLHVVTGADYLERLLAERPGDVVVIAGRNDAKMDQIEQLTRAGFFVLADKPWIISDTALPRLEAAIDPDRPLSLDIMTERFEITTMLQKELLAEEAVFGRIRIDDDGSPSVFKESVHHLYKLVNNQPLVRPGWYFDIDVQGEGVTDVTTHLVDMTHWMLCPDQAIDFERDIDLEQARRWSTRIPLDIFTRITGHEAFPPELEADVSDEVLNYFSNGEIVYRLKGIPIQVRVIWNLEIPPGGGDTHQSRIQGTRADLVIRQLPERNFKVELLVVPHGDTGEVQRALDNCLQQWADRYPGLSTLREQERILIQIPDALRTTHEEHFCQVRDAYLAAIDQPGNMQTERRCLLAKYTLLARAREMARHAPFYPLETDAGPI